VTLVVVFEMHGEALYFSVVVVVAGGGGCVLCWLMARTVQAT
jgi:hypothetical protein